MRYAQLAVAALLLTGCASERTAQHVARPHTCNWYKPAPHGEGVTDIAFVVDTSGRLRDIRIVKSSGSDEIDKASMGCAARWHYFPAAMDGKPVDERWGARMDWRGNTVAVFELAPAP